jgi:hypothetical protein
VVIVSKYLARDLAPSLLAVGWRRDDRRAAVHAFVQACRDVVGELAVAQRR